MRVRRVAVHNAVPEGRRAQHYQPAKPLAAVARRDMGWKAHGRAWLGALAVCAALLVAVQLVMNVVSQPSHRPQIMMSDEAKVALGLRFGEVPETSKEKVEALLRSIPTCTVGKKYGALCQDGTYTSDATEDACHNHKGVKEWVECR